MAVDGPEFIRRRSEPGKPIHPPPRTRRSRRRFGVVGVQAETRFARRVSGVSRARSRLPPETVEDRSKLALTGVATGARRKSLEVKTLRVPHEGVRLHRLVEELRPDCLRGSALFSRLGPMMSAARAHTLPLRAAFLSPPPTGMLWSLGIAAPPLRGRSRRSCMRSSGTRRAGGPHSASRPPSADMRSARPGVCSAYAAATRPGYRKDSG